jgi:hypothetical protein
MAHWGDIMEWNSLLHYLKYNGEIFVRKFKLVVKGDESCDCPHGNENEER